MTVKAVFVTTKNVRNFLAMMGGLDLAAGEGRLGLVYGRAGRGKTRTAQWWAAANGAVYMRVVTVWSELDFLRTLCAEFGMPTPPLRRGACYAALMDRLSRRPSTIILDEIEKQSSRWLDVVRDIADMAGVPIVLVGEEELAAAMRQNRRVWSRTYSQVEFGPIAPADIVLYAREAAGLAVQPEAAAEIHRRSGGDFRLVRRDVLLLAQYAAAERATEVTEKMVRAVSGLHLYGGNGKLNKGGGNA